MESVLIIAKELLIALIDKSPIYAIYKSEDEQLPAKRVGESYKILVKAVLEAGK